jgi:hypothetical protein
MRSSSKQPLLNRLRCALYTRVSTEHGLEQEFNSLDNQREAAEAYIKSQAHEGWRLLPSRYDDGGYSGGSMERPGLQQLLVWCHRRFFPCPKGLGGTDRRPSHCGIRGLGIRHGREGSVPDTTRAAVSQRTGLPLRTSLPRKRRQPARLGLLRQSLRPRSSACLPTDPLPLRRPGREVPRYQLKI